MTALYRSAVVGSFRCVSYQTVAASDIRKGMIYKHDNMYKEVTDFENQKTGRGSKYLVTYVQLGTGLVQQDAFIANKISKVTQVEPDTFSYEVAALEYAGMNTLVHLVDKEDSPVVVPLSSFGKQSEEVQSGTKVTMWRDENEIVKLWIE
jgi:translation elongation factor P/translation initiation factor 5A